MVIFEFRAIIKLIKAVWIEWVTTWSGKNWINVQLGPHRKRAYFLPLSRLKVIYFRYFDNPITFGYIFDPDLKNGIDYPLYPYATLITEMVQAIVKYHVPCPVCPATVGLGVIYETGVKWFIPCFSQKGTSF